MKDAGKKDSSKGEFFALFFSLIILIFNFGSLLSALIPILVGATTIIFANTVIKMSGMEIIPISQVLASLVGIALSIDYSLFIVSRFREELKKHQDHTDALSVALSNSGKTIIVSALIMLCSISALLIPDVSSSRIVVKNLMVVVTVSFINSILFLPIFLIYTRKLLEKPRFIASFLHKSDNYLLWRKFSTNIVNHPKRYFFLSLTLLILIAIPVFNLKLWEPSQTLAPQDSEAMIGYKLLENDNWGGELVPVEIAVKGDRIVYNQEFISYIYDFTEYLAKNPNVSSVQSITSWNSNFKKEDYLNLFNTLYATGFISQFPQISALVNVNSGSNITMIRVFPKSLMDIESSHEIIRYARQFQFKPEKYEVSVGGMVARARDFTNELYNYIPQMFFLIFFSIYILLFFYMKSVILPIKAAIMNFLPILSAFGILTLIFQYGWFHEILRTNVNNAVTAMVPITLFCIVFGLSMDYEVLILSRISENYEESGDVKEAVIEGLSRSGSVITGAALILLVVFIPGIFSTSPGIKEICIGIISAIFIDSTIVRLLLVPSFVVLMGKWNWWNPLKK
jgi:RND superfamily putative drug exporter